MLANAPHVFRQPLWKRFLLLLASVAFVACGLLLIDDGSLFWGIVSIILFGGGGIVVLFSPRNVLIVTREGVELVYALRQKDRKFFPWNQIEKIDIVTQTTPIPGQHRSQRSRLLALYLHDPSLYAPRSSGGKMVQTLSRAIGSVTASDGGTAQVYIPSALFSGSLESVRETLESYRTQFTTTPVQ